MTTFFLHPYTFSRLHLFAPTRYLWLRYLCTYTLFVPFFFSYLLFLSTYTPYTHAILLLHPCYLRGLASG